ncbi:MAG TPA: class I SAM-dependent methyltransferase [Candidatus Polarisedimenticolia bacterium]|nr:class I SAM-dependent methyltransferase [Candidatus Polarisedimenticolia bacterium]
MSASRMSCDLCLGTELRLSPSASPCGRQLMECAGCGLVCALPGPDRPGQEGAPGRRAARSDQKRAAALRRILDGGRVLEVECGAGRVLASLDPRRFEVVGLEPRDQEAARARERLRSAGARGSVMTGALPDGRLPIESFDLAALFGSLARARSPRATLMEVSRLLRDGGYVVIETPSLASLTARLRGPRWQPLKDPTADYFFTPQSLARLATGCGFQPGTTLLPMPAGWPAPGTLVYIARKAAASLRLAGPAELAEAVQRLAGAAPLGAIH